MTLVAHVSTTTDFLPAERERDITIQLSVSIPLKLNGTDSWALNLIDISGHATDFNMEVESPSRVVDRAVVRVDPWKELKNTPTLKGVWRQSDR